MLEPSAPPGPHSSLLIAKHISRLGHEREARRNGLDAEVEQVHDCLSAKVGEELGREENGEALGSEDEHGLVDYEALEYAEDPRKNELLPHATADKEFACVKDEGDEDFFSDQEDL